MPFAPVLTIEIEQELDGRWLAEVPIVPGALAYGSTRAEAAARAEAPAQRAPAERIEHREPVAEISGLFEAVSDTRCCARSKRPPGNIKHVCPPNALLNGPRARLNHSQNA